MLQRCWSVVRLCPCWEVVPEVPDCSERHHGLVPEVSYYCVGLVAGAEDTATRFEAKAQSPMLCSELQGPGSRQAAAL